MFRSKCSRELYCSFLEVTSPRYSVLALSEVVPPYTELSHDSISRWLSDEKVQPKDLWAKARIEVAYAWYSCVRRCGHRQEPER